MNGLLELSASTSKICRFLHLPLQHGSNKILKAMGRNYSSAQFSEFVSRAARLIPDICLGSDVIVGFPGETDEDFSECQNLLENLPLAYLHVFSYSRREGTPAASYPEQVTAKVSSQRHKILTQTGSVLSAKFLSSQKNKNFMIIPEKKTGNIITGWTDNYIKANVLAEGQNVKDLMEKPFLNVRLIRPTNFREMTAELI
jgi:threonylcarbamoyladenosine tRNA methylthiotransferase MtaB